MRSRSMGITACVIASLTVGAAKAKELTVTVSGPGDPTAVFTLPSSPAPAATGDNSFQVNDLSATINGVATTIDSVVFYDSDVGGGLWFDTNTMTDEVIGTQYYGGGESTPTLNPGVYSDQTNYYSDHSDTVTISAAAPEPRTWAMIMIGAAGIGALLRTRRRATAAA